MSNCILSNRNNPYQIGDCFFTTTDIDPGTRFGGTWSKLSDGIAIGPVFGNGYNLGATDGSQLYGLSSQQYSNNRYYFYKSAFGVAPGGGQGSSDYPSTKGLGVPTKTQLGSHLEYSGLVADTISVKVWVRTA